MKTKLFTIFLLLIIVSLWSCKRQPNIGHITFLFEHKIDGQNVIFDTIKYTNAAGNPYMITEVQYFISDVTLHKSDGVNKVITTNNKNIYYIDTNIPSTQIWNIIDDIPAGDYNSISFTFGIDSIKNKSFILLNPPEANMEWPIPLGGGYHYMKLNGKWKDASNVIHNINTHLGIGKINNENNTTFIQNYFIVNIPKSSFTIDKNVTIQIPIIMNIESWYKTPNVYNHNVFGQSIMENQTAMHKLIQNGIDVFTIGTITKK